MSSTNINDVDDYLSNLSTIYSSSHDDTIDLYFLGQMGSDFDMGQRRRSREEKLFEGKTPLHSHAEY